METISNLASAASKAIYGEQKPETTTQGNETLGQEPISGEQGKGTINEPYDQGNSGKELPHADIAINPNVTAMCLAACGVLTLTVNL